MIFEHLTEKDTKALDVILKSGQINGRTLPVGAATGWDSMGPLRNPKTDSLYPGARETLGRFSETLLKYNLLFAVATNGPDIEGEDILNALVGPVAAFAVTEGGGRLIDRNPQTGVLGYTNLASEEELSYLVDLEKVVSERPLMKALLGDRISTDEHSPIRTPYSTNIVVTLPVKFDVLNARLSAVGVDLQRELPGVSPADYVKQVLGYAHAQYTQAILGLGLGDRTTVLTKLQNRRTYVMPKHDHAGAELNKYGGVETGSMHLAFTPGYSNQMYDIRNSVYVADKIVDMTGEGQPIIGSSERSMVIALAHYFVEDLPAVDNINKTKIYAMQPIQFRGGILYIGDVTCRLAVNVTMDDGLPRMDRVEDVSVLHIGSGLKAIEGITYLYQELHG